MAGASAALHAAISSGGVPLLRHEIPIWDRMLRRLLLPHEPSDPPATPVVPRLDTVDSPHERFRFLMSKGFDTHCRRARCS